MAGCLIFPGTAAGNLVKSLADSCLLAVISILRGSIDTPIFTLSPWIDSYAIYDSI
ncbi:hypothetical protein PN499_25700 [Kamptonema animale CS-326]|jgi:large-conductance mechanosensitive channel|nr:hypothetical protein [Kamptonema animale CS-326]